MDLKFKEIPVPEELDRVVKDSMKKIRAQQKARRIKRIAAGFGMAAAVFAFGIIFFVGNPAVAAKLPVIGHIFELLQDDNDFSGNFTEVSQPLTKKNGDPAEEEHAEKGGRPAERNSAEQQDGEKDSSGADSTFSKTADGMTITLSEVYCNDQAIYISMEMKTEGTMPLKEEKQQIETAETYSFNPEKQYSMPDLEGRRLDEHTYVGMIRLDLNEKTTAGLADEEAAMKKAEEMGFGEGMVVIDADTPMKTVEIPDTFTLQLKIKKIFSESGKASENIKGPWEFTLQLDKNRKDTTTVEINEVNEQGVGLEKVVKDRFEITIYDTYENGQSASDYFPVILDADGMRMPNNNGDGGVMTVPIQDRDVSKIDVYLVDYIRWMDELGLRGDIWYDNPDMRTEDGKTMKEVLDEEAAYHKEVKFE